MNQNYITIDLSSIVKMDFNIKTLNEIYPTVTEKSIIDEDAIDVIKYAIKAGKVFPIYLGQISPIFQTSTISKLRQIGIPKYLFEHFTFSSLSLKEFKQKIYNKYMTIKFAYDKTKSNEVWKEHDIEVLE